MAFPPTLCSILGRSESIRVPLPAASITVANGLFIAEDIPLYNHLAQANEDNGLYLNEIYSKFYNQYWDETLDQDSSIDYICKNTLVGFKKNMKELLRQENDDYYDKEYWSEKLEEFFEFFRKKIDLLAESWMIDLCQYKFMF